MSLPPIKGAVDIRKGPDVEDLDNSQVELVGSIKGIPEEETSKLKPDSSTKKPTKVTKVAPVDKEEDPAADAAGKAPEPAKAGYFELYKYSSKWERFVMKMGLVFSLLSGALEPFQATIMGWFVKLFNPVSMTREE